MRSNDLPRISISRRSGAWRSTAVGLVLLAAVPARAQTPMNVYVPGLSAGTNSAHLERVLADSLRRAGFNVLDAETARSIVSKQDLQGWIGCAFDTYVCPAPPPGVKLDLVVAGR